MGVQDLEQQAAFVQVPFPEYFGVDPMVFTAGVDSTALEVVEPQNLAHELRGRYQNSVYSHNRDIGWVVLSTAEFDAIVKDPASLAERTAARNRTSLPATFANRTQDERNAVAMRAGAHVLEPRIEKMHDHMRHYQARVDELRKLTERIDHYWMRRELGVGTLIMATNARDDYQQILQTLADSRGWSEDEFSAARLAMDYRLVGGERKKHNLMQKIGYWGSMTRVVGNHILDKRTTFKAKIGQAQTIVDKALNPSTTEATV